MVLECGLMPGCSNASADFSASALTCDNCREKDL